MDQGQTRLWVDGVRSPIVSQVTRHDGPRCTIEQALPFLSIDNEVHDEARRRGRIEHVRLAYEDGIPRLVVDLVYDETADRGDPTVAGLDDTVPAMAAQPPVLGEVEERPSARQRRDETVPFVTERARSSREIIISDAPPAPAPPLAPPAGADLGARLVWWLTRFGEAAERVAQELTARLRPTPA